jgi:hypothetical protein
MTGTVPARFMVDPEAVSARDPLKCTGPPGTGVPFVGVSWIWATYLAGMVVGLWRTDGPWPVKLLLAILWPLGPAVFVLVVTGLLLAAAVAFPWVGALAVAAGVLAWLL